MPSRIDFYSVEVSPPSRAVWMVLEELGLSYEEKSIDLFKGEHKSPDYQKINPRMKVPAIKDGDLCIGESRAIAAYLVSAYGSRNKKNDLYPEDPKKRAVVDQHLYISENVFEQINSYVNFGGVLFGSGVTNKENLNAVKAALSSVKGYLSKHSYTAFDQITLADIFYYIAVGILEITDFDDYTEYPKLVAWKKKMATLPHHKKTCQEPLAKFRAIYQKKLQETLSAKQ